MDKKKKKLKIAKIPMGSVDVTSAKELAGRMTDEDKKKMVADKPIHLYEGESKLEKARRETNETGLKLIRKYRKKQGY